ncbi:hypothetical protein Tsubulata_030839 [Turnera subulata]|uniref:DUF4283 domain-containing protein n=1 Tax=Turnera subulata TaxID=218843 RepID=A0A9Q0GG20_9ROSI|nr:hypothetical protein Tsubulata_030839 [Turnera subulata]
MTKRLCWINIRGIPLLAWSAKFINLVGSSIGKVVKIAPETLNRTYLEEARVQVLTEFGGFLTKELTVTISEGTGGTDSDESPEKSVAGKGNEYGKNFQSDSPDINSDPFEIMEILQPKSRGGEVIIARDAGCSGVKTIDRGVIAHEEGLSDVNAVDRGDFIKEAGLVRVKSTNHDEQEHDPCSESGDINAGAVDVVLCSHCHQSIWREVGPIIAITARSGPVKISNAFGLLEDCEAFDPNSPKEASESIGPRQTNAQYSTGSSKTRNTRMSGGRSDSYLVR